MADRGDQTLRLDYDLNQDTLVLDVGGYEGQWASDLFSRYQCNIKIFEPVSIFAQRMKIRFSRNSHIEVFNFALGGSHRKEVISICEDGSSVFGKSSQREEIVIFDVADWITEEGLENIGLMKINIEGGEYELLERLIETGLVTVITNIQVQFHDLFHDALSRKENISERMKETHRITYEYPFVWENWVKRTNI